MSHFDEQSEQLREVLDGHLPVREMDWARQPAAKAAESVPASQLAEYRTSALQQLVNLVLDGGDETVRKACVDLIRAAQAELDQPVNTPEPLERTESADDAKTLHAHLHWFLTTRVMDDPETGDER